MSGRDPGPWHDQNVWCNWVELFRSVQFSSCAVNEALRGFSAVMVGQPGDWLIKKLQRDGKREKRVHGGVKNGNQ